MNFGTFPALPSTAAPSSSASSPGAGPSSSGRTIFAPGPSSKTTAPSGKPEKQVAALPPPTPKDSKKDVVTREGQAELPRDEIIKPVVDKNEPATQQMMIDDDAEIAWREAMQIPSGFAGLSLVPKSVAALPPPASNMAAVNETQPAATPILGASFKSGFDPSEQPVFEILKDCGDPAQDPGCDPRRLSSGAPVLSDYFYDSKAHQGDLNPDTKDTFEIGTVVVGTEKDADTGKEIAQVEVAFHILPGFAPGKYQVQLTGKTAKLVGSFEVVAAAQALETSMVRGRPAPESRPAPKSVPK